MLPKFVCEFTTNHMGNLHLALRMAEKAAWAGCDYVKMQKKDVETFYTEAKLDSRFTSPYGKTYRDYRTIFEFSKEDFDRFDRKCKELGIPWFATAQDVPSLEFLLKYYDLDLYKVASTNSRNLPFLRFVAENVPKDKTIVISVGGSTLDEIEESLSIVSDHRMCLLHCVSEYPCPPEKLRLGNIEVLQKEFGDARVSIGFSGHEEGIVGTLAAVDLGATLVERHFTLSRHSFVHHIECSLEPEEYKRLIEIARSGSDLNGLYSDLPSEAFESSFGMSVVEEDFLVRNKYGRMYLREGSQFEQ